MQIAFLISGRQVPSSRYRVLQYVPALEALGHRCLVLPSRPPKYRGWNWLGNRLSEVPRFLFRLADLLRVARSAVDVVVVERELFSSRFSGLERCLHRGRAATVLDVDDALFVLHPRKFSRLLGNCDLVIAGNELLREHIAADHPEVGVVPTCLDLARFPPRSVRAAEVPVIGWTGTAGNYPQLQPLLEPLRQVAREESFRLRLIAERPPAELDLGGLPVDFQPWWEEHEIADLQQIDIGLMPLEDNRWNRYKCGLKLLQYMAAGIPAVASPVGVNAAIVRHAENGMLASTPDEWARCLLALLRNDDLRLQLALAGRQTVERTYSVEAQAPRLLDLLQRAVQLRAGRRT